MADYKVGDLVHDTHRKDEGMVVQATSTDAGYQTVVVLFVGASAPYTYQVLKDETIPGLVRMVDEYQRVAPRGAAKLKANQIVDPSPGALATPHVAGGSTVVATAKYEGQTKGVVAKVLQRLRSSDHVGIVAKLQLPATLVSSRDGARAAIWSMVQEELGLSKDVISSLPSDEQARAFQAIIDAGNKVFAAYGIDDRAKSEGAASRLREINTYRLSGPRPQPVNYLEDLTWTAPTGNTIPQLAGTPIGKGRVPRRIERRKHGVGNSPELDVLRVFRGSGGRYYAVRTDGRIAPVSFLASEEPVTVHGVSRSTKEFLAELDPRSAVERKTAREGALRARTRGILGPDVFLDPHASIAAGRPMNIEMFLRAYSAGKVDISPTPGKPGILEGVFKVFRGPEDTPYAQDLRTRLHEFVNVHQGSMSRQKAADIRSAINDLRNVRRMAGGGSLADSDIALQRLLRMDGLPAEIASLLDGIRGVDLLAVAEYRNRTRILSQNYRTLQFFEQQLRRNPAGADELLARLPESIRPYGQQMVGWARTEAEQASLGIRTYSGSLIARLYGRAPAARAKVADVSARLLSLPLSNILDTAYPLEEASPYYEQLKSAATGAIDELKAFTTVQGEQARSDSSLASLAPDVDDLQQFNEAAGLAGERDLGMRMRGIRRERTPGSRFTHFSPSSIDIGGISQEGRVSLLEIQRGLPLIDYGEKLGQFNGATVGDVAQEVLRRAGVVPASPGAPRISGVSQQGASGLVDAIRGRFTETGNFAATTLEGYASEATRANAVLAETVAGAIARAGRESTTGVRNFWQAAIGHIGDSLADATLNDRAVSFARRIENDLASMGGSSLPEGIRWQFIQDRLPKDPVFRSRVLSLLPSQVGPAAGPPTSTVPSWASLPQRLAQLREDAIPVFERLRTIFRASLLIEDKRYTALLRNDMREVRAQIDLLKSQIPSSDWNWGVESLSSAVEAVFGDEPPTDGISVGERIILQYGLVPADRPAPLVTSGSDVVSTQLPSMAARRVVHPTDGAFELLLTTTGGQDTHQAAVARSVVRNRAGDAATSQPVYRVNGQDLTGREWAHYLRTGEMPFSGNSRIFPQDLGADLYVPTQGSSGAGVQLAAPGTPYFDIETPMRIERIEDINGVYLREVAVAGGDNPYGFVIEEDLWNTREGVVEEASRIRSLVSDLTDTGGFPGRVTISGHNARDFDVKRITERIWRLAQNGDIPLGEAETLISRLAGARVIDTLATGRALEGGLAPASLQYLLKRYGLADPDPGVAHTAAGDTAGGVRYSNMVRSKMEEREIAGTAKRLVVGDIVSQGERALVIEGFNDGDLIVQERGLSWTRAGQRVVHSSEVAEWVRTARFIGTTDEALGAAKPSLAAEFFQRQVARLSQTDIAGISDYLTAQYAVTGTPSVSGTLGQATKEAMLASGLDPSQHLDLFKRLAAEGNVNRRLAISQTYWEALTPQATEVGPSGRVVDPMAVLPGMEPTYIDGENAPGVIDRWWQAAQGSLGTTKDPQKTKAWGTRLRILETELGRLEAEDASDQAIAQKRLELDDWFNQHPDEHAAMRRRLYKIETQALANTDETFGTDLIQRRMGLAPIIKEGDKFPREAAAMFVAERNRLLYEQISGGGITSQTGVSFGAITDEEVRSALGAVDNLSDPVARLRRIFTQDMRGLAIEAAADRVKAGALLGGEYAEKALDLSENLFPGTGNQVADELLARANDTMDRYWAAKNSLQMGIEQTEAGDVGRQVLGDRDIHFPMVVQQGEDGTLTASARKISELKQDEISRILSDPRAPRFEYDAVPHSISRQLGVTGAAVSEDIVTASERMAVGKAGDAVESIAFLKDHLPTPRMKQAGMLLGGGIALMAATGMLLPHGNARKTNTEEWGPNATVRGAGIAEAPPVSLTNQRVVVEAYDRHGQDVSKVRRALKHMVPGGAMPDVRLADETVEMSREDIKALMAEYMNAK